MRSSIVTPWAEGRTRPRPHREQQGVVSELLASLGVDYGPRCVEPLECGADELDTDIARDLLQRAPPGGAVGKRLAHPHRAVDELRLRRKQRRRHPLAGKVAERERCLEPGNPATRNQDPEWGVKGTR